MFYGPGGNFVFADYEVYVLGICVTAGATDAHQLTAIEVQGSEDAGTKFEAWKQEDSEIADAQFIDSGPFIGARGTAPSRKPACPRSRENH